MDEWIRTQDAKSVIETDQNDIFLQKEVGAVQGRVTVSWEVTTAVYPNHDRSQIHPFLEFHLFLFTF